MRYPRKYRDQDGDIVTVSSKEADEWNSVLVCFREGLVALENLDRIYESIFGVEPAHKVSS